MPDDSQGPPPETPATLLAAAADRRAQQRWHEGQAAFHEGMARSFAREAASLEERAAMLERGAKTESGETLPLQDVNISARVNTSMVNTHRLAISKGRSGKDPFHVHIRAVKPKGYTMRSLAEKLGIPASLLSMYRASKASGLARQCPMKRAKQIEAWTGWPADEEHWPNGFVP